MRFGWIPYIPQGPCFYAHMTIFLSSVAVDVVWTTMMIGFGIPCIARINPNSKVHGANMGPIWGRHDPNGPHVGPMNFAVWVGSCWPLDFLNSITSMTW